MSARRADCIVHCAASGFASWRFGAEVRLSGMSHSTADCFFITSASNVVAAVLGPYAAPLTASERNNAHRLVSRLVDGVGTPSPRANKNQITHASLAGQIKITDAALRPLRAAAVAVLRQ